jgi:hypothetical protein
VLRIAVIVCVLALAPVPARAQADRHSCPEHWAGLIDGQAEIKYSLSDIWDQFDVPEIEQVGTVAFTDRPGTFRTINCTKGRLTPTERQEFYPIGMILKPLRVLTLSDEEHDVFAGGHADLRLEVPRTYLLVLTEFGHLKIIRERDVQYMVSGATYFFAESSTFVYLCDEAEACPGNQRLGYAPDGTSRPVCGPEACRESTAIAPMGGYAVGGAEHVVDGAPRTDWSRVVAARRTLREQGLRRAGPKVAAEYCLPFRVKAYEAGGTPRLLSAEDEFLTLCGDRGATSVVPLRAVTKAQALALFEDMAEGIFYRQFGTRGTTLVSIISPAEGPEAQGRKECYESVSTRTRNALRSEAGWAVKLGGLVGLGQEASREDESTRETTIADGEYLRFSNYLAPDFYADAFLSIDDGGSVYSLVFIADCDESQVNRPKSVTLDYPAFLDGRMEISAQALTNTYDDSYSTDDNPLPGWDLNDRSPDLIRAGHFFDIHDVETYYLWRAAVAEHLEEQTSVGDLVREIAARDPDRAQIVHNFFTHLLMAAVFSYNIDYAPPAANPF